MYIQWVRQENKCYRD